MSAINALSEYQNNWRALCPSSKKRRDSVEKYLELWCEARDSDALLRALAELSHRDDVADAAVLDAAAILAKEQDGAKALAWARSNRLDANKQFLEALIAYYWAQAKWSDVALIANERIANDGGASERELCEIRVARVVSTSIDTRKSAAGQLGVSALSPTPVAGPWSDPFCRTIIDGFTCWDSLHFTHDQVAVSKAYDSFLRPCGKATRAHREIDTRIRAALRSSCSPRESDGWREWTDFSSLMMSELRFGSEEDEEASVTAIEHALANSLCAPDALGRIRTLASLASKALGHSPNYDSRLQPLQTLDDETCRRRGFDR